MPSGMYNIVLKNSNALVVNNVIGNINHNNKANFAIIDNSNATVTNNTISGLLAVIQGNSNLSEFKNNNSIIENTPKISITCNSFYNFPQLTRRNCNRFCWTVEVQNLLVFHWFPL